MLYLLSSFEEEGFDKSKGTGIILEGKSLFHSQRIYLQAVEEKSLLMTHVGGLLAFRQDDRKGAQDSVLLEMKDFTIVEKGRWIYVELMAKLNEPTSESNGELALWIDGKLVSHPGKGFLNCCCSPLYRSDKVYKVKLTDGKSEIIMKI